MKQDEKMKLKWYLLLFVAISLFFAALVMQQMILNLIVIGLALYIYKYGQPILFKAYDERRKQKIEEVTTVRQAAQEVLNSGNLFKKK
ncbi:hypothetical protein RsY01_669 [Lactococcus reticulitermitis]|uniref:Uncharacterized protein n=1 Tax=Pseudolactococcus reticulitermitis TaxID=2025039 RepID=A0A224WY41_9LACT|nr:hypothetical protein RsY01_669 [Lactococcus reticulitermitis]